MYLYNFNNNSVYYAEKDTVLMSRPLAFKANKDIQINIYKYNPLREEITVENSYSEWFLADSSKLNGLIVLPTQKTLEDDIVSEEGKPEKVKDDSNKKPDPCKAVKTCNIKFNRLSSDYKDAVSVYNSYINTLELVNDDYYHLKSLPELTKAAVKSQVEGNFLKVYSSNLSLQGIKVNNDINTFNSRLITKHEEDFYKKITDQETPITIFRDSIVTNVKPGECKAGYDELLASLNSLLDNLKEFKKTRNEKILPGLSKITSTYDKLMYFANNEPSFITPALTIDKDMHTILIYRRNLDEKEKFLVDKINIEPKCGFKIDISTGLFISGLYDQEFKLKSRDSIYNQEYISGDTIADSLAFGTYKAIYRQDALPVSFGGMIFLNAHTQNPGIFNYGISIGFGALFNDQARLTYSAGLSGIIGKKQRFILNIGAAIGQVDRLETPYKTDVYYKETLDTVQ
jgi:hypothetical protein